ncbi:glycosyltransferase [Streptantibioticus parmotrematis]|uniref:glycosyltransferase n=1 Tax=Streptantibioticus parmotrematis TaxID=2873249 RepID=UPI00207BE0D6|nr:glycosyltransferase [Streptantibioticus parmotrematis]
MASRTAPPAPPQGATPARSYPAVLRGRVRAALSYEPLLRNGHVLTLSSLMTAGLGAIFWVLATHWYSAATVGRSYAVIAAVSLLAGVGQLNLADVLVRFVPTAGRHTRRVVLRCYGASLACTAMVAACFLLVIPAVTPGLDFLRGPVAGPCFVAATAGYALFIVQDGALTGLRRTHWVLGENALFAVVKTALLPLAAGLVFASGILLSWTGALAVSLVVTNVYLLRHAVPAHERAGPELGAPPARLLGYAAADYVGAFFRLAAYNVVPLLVLDELGDAKNAYFSIAWVIAYTLYLAAYNMGSSLIVEAAHAPERLAEQAHRVLRHCGGLLVVGVVALWFCGPWLLSFFGAAYAREATGLLRLLALSALPNLLLNVAIDVARARRRLAWAVALQAVLCVLVLGLTAWLLPVMGLNGVGVAWLVTECLIGLALLLTLPRWLPASHEETVAGPRGDRPGRPEATGEAPGTLSLTVVICAYTPERWDDLADAVRSVLEQQHPADEILLVVDHCPELAERAAAELRGVRVLVNTERQGLSGARNTGVAAARCDVVAFLDDDAAAEPDWTARLLAAYRDPAVLGVGGLVRAWWETGRPPWFPPEFDWVVGCSYRGLPRTRGGVRNLIGANMSFRRAHLLAAGGFRTDLGRVGTRPLGCEETELCLRVAARDPGSTLLYEPAAAVRHHVPAARTTRRYFRARCYAEGLSKAAVARLAGPRRALSSERAYLRSALPRAVVRALTPGTDAGPRTLGALTMGVGATALGYAVGRVRRPHDVPSGERTRPRSRARLFARIALPLAVLLWLVSLRHVDLGAMRDLGLVQVLPVSYWAGLLVLAAGFCAALRDRRTSGWTYAAFVLALIAFLHATPALLYPELRYAWAWKHVAVTDELLRYGAIPPSFGPLAVYAQWPGFFALNYLVLRGTGLASPLSYASWWPVLTNVALIAPLLLLYRSFSRSRRLAWGGVFVFFCCSWVGQDYFSPQAFAYVLYVCVIALVVRRLPRPWASRTAPAVAYAGDAVAARHARSRTDREGRAVGRGAQRAPGAGWLLALALPIGAIVCSHPLTPVMLIGTLLALAIPRRNRRVVLPVLLLTTALTLVWDATEARSYLSQNFHAMLLGLTQPEANAGSGLLGLTGVSTGQVAVAWADRVLSGGVLLLAALALLVRPALRRTPLALLALAPLPWVVANSYGGEMIFRVYLFALPATAFATATLLLRPALTTAGAAGSVPRGRLGRLRGAGVPVLVVALLAALSLAYYGKEDTNYFTPSETAAAQWLYAHAPRFSLIVAASDNFPYAYSDYGYHDRLWLDEAAPVDQRLLLRDPATELRVLSGGGPARPVYLILTRAQEAQVSSTGALPPGTVPRIETALAADPASYPVLYRGPDAIVYRVLPASAGGP